MSRIADAFTIEVFKQVGADCGGHLSGERLCLLPSRRKVKGHLIAEIAIHEVTYASSCQSACQDLWIADQRLVGQDQRGHSWMATSD